MFSTVVVIVDTEISKQILQIQQKLVKNPIWRDAIKPVDYLQSAEELNLGPPNTKGGGFEPGTSGKSSALTTRPGRLLCFWGYFLYPLGFQYQGSFASVIINSPPVLVALLLRRRGTSPV